MSRSAKRPKRAPACSGRQYAILDLQIKNGSDQTLSLNVVVTVPDKSGKAVNPVYVEEAKVSDFAAICCRAARPRSIRLRGASSPRLKVTVVVDFDGVHSSAVFRGGLS